MSGNWFHTYAWEKKLISAKLNPKGVRWGSGNQYFKQSEDTAGMHLIMTIP